MLRRSIGWFNATWMTSVAVPLYAMAPIVEHHAEWAIGGMAVLNLAALAFTRGLHAHPAHHAEDHASAHVPAEYRGLLRAARALLPTSYVLMAAMHPILPYRFHAIETPVELETPVTGTWMLMRLVSIVRSARSQIGASSWRSKSMASPSPMP